MRCVRVLLLGLSFLFSAGCGDSKCGEFIDGINACYDRRCTTDFASIPFCGCWVAGMDLDLETCQCRELQPEAQLCDIYNTTNYRGFDCDGAMTVVRHFCL